MAERRKPTDVLASIEARMLVVEERTADIKSEVLKLRTDVNGNGTGDGGLKGRVGALEQVVEKVAGPKILGVPLPWFAFFVVLGLLARSQGWLELDGLIRLLAGGG